MFDENLITVPYVYTSKKQDTPNKVNLPIFNVAQLYFNAPEQTNTTTQNGDNTKMFNFGKQIYEYYNSNDLKNTEPFSSSSTLKWYPWPGAVNSNISHASQLENYAEQLYSRLISVSPFDNTIIYASRPNTISLATGGQDQFLGYSGNESNFASFWIGNSSTGNVINMVIPNLSSAPYNGVIGTELIASTSTSGNNKSGGIYDLYKNGFWFDVNSLTGQNNKLNLYFPTTGSKKNTIPSGADSNVKSTPIAFISPNLNSYVSIDNLTNTSSNSINKVLINNNSFTNYITSRADLSLWFTRTYQNLTMGANAYNNDVVLNDYDVDNQTRAVATSLTQKLTNTTWFNDTNKSVELFSIWEVGQYSNLAVKRAQIVTNINETQQATPTLNVTLKFNLTNTSWSNPFYKDDAGIKKIKTFEYPVTIPNASWQFLTSWSTNVKLKDWSQTENQNNITINNQLVSASGSGGSAASIQGNYGSSWGTINLGKWTSSNGTQTWSAISLINQSSPLRIELGFDFENESSTWVNNLDQKFKQTYPINPSNNETSFSAILSEFIKYKVENLTYGDDINNPTNGMYSPGQITIKAYLKLNPYWITTNNSAATLYTLTTTDGKEITAIYDSANQITYLYQDQYSGNRTIYKQNSTSYTSNSQYGFGASVNSEISNSWATIPTKNFIAQIESTFSIKDIIFRDSTSGINSTSDLFNVAY